MSSSLFRIILIAGLGGFLFGFDTGIISGAIFFIQKKLSPSIFMTQAVVSVALVGALIGSFCSAYLVNQWGRLPVIRANAALFFCATLLSAFAPSLWVLILSRMGIGIAIGISCYVIPLYISELSPALYRGSLVAINTIAVTGGIFVSYLTSCILSPDENWRWMLGIGTIPAAVLWIFSQILPESPRWLIQQGKMFDAKKILCFLHDSHYAEREFTEIQNGLKENKSHTRDLFTPQMRKRLGVGIILAIVQQFCGINGILYYAPILLQKMGFQGVSQIMFWTLFIGFLNFLMTFVVLLKVDSHGRRLLLLGGLMGMTISLFMLAFGLTFELTSFWTKSGVLISLFAFIAFYAGSIGCIFWIVIAEIYPYGIRGLAMGIASGFNWTANLIVSFTFLSLLESIGTVGTFSLYGFACLLSFLFCYLWLPETAQRSLEEIDTISF
jgi:sugar porter (SP) family MFS transporter